MKKNLREEKDKNEELTSDNDKLTDALAALTYKYDKLQKVTTKKN